MEENGGGFFEPVAELLHDAERVLLTASLAFFFAAFFRSIVGATTFQTSLEIGFCIIACVALSAALLMDCTLAKPTYRGLTLPIAMSAGAIVDVICGAIIGRASTTYITLVFLIAGSVLLVVLYSRRWKGKDRSWLDNRAACTYETLGYPLGYLAALIIVLGLIFGCLFVLHVGGLNRGISQLGFFVGCAAFAFVTAPLMLATRRNLELMVKIMLLFLIAGFSLIMLDQPSFGSLLVLAFGFCCYLYVSFAMIFDFYRTFRLPMLFALGFLALLFASLLIGFFVGQLLALSSSITNLAKFTMVSIVLISIITILGLGTRHSWNPRDLLVPKVPLTESPQKASGFFRSTVAEIAAEAGLTAREQEVFALMAKGRNSAGIEKALVISNHTARAHVLNIYRKLGIHSQEAVLDLVEERVAKKREELSR